MAREWRRGFRRRVLELKTVMSAQATLGENAARPRYRPFETIAACGFATWWLVAVGGVSLGFFIWYVFATRVHDPQVVNAALIPALLVGVLATVVLWYAYGAYFSRRGGIALVTSLQYDAISWSALSLFAFAVAQPYVPIGIGKAAGIAVAAFALAKLFVATAFNATVRDVLITFVVTRIPLFVIAEIAWVTIGQRAGTHVSESANPLLAVWGRWDAVHYLNIAREGYHGTEMAFFPLYPTLISLLARIVGNQLIAGLLISNLALFFGLLYFYKLVEHQYNREVAHRATFYISIFPTAIFFSAVYTESLFFALTVASFYYIREHKWLTARRGRAAPRPVLARNHDDHRTVRSARRVPKPHAHRAHRDRSGDDRCRARDVYGHPLGHHGRPALLLTRTDALGSPSRAAVG
jgi:hypothetical protein